MQGYRVNTLALKLAVSSARKMLGGIDDLGTHRQIIAILVLFRL
jgi:hypothetical protein